MVELMHVSWSFIISTDDALLAKDYLLFKLLFVPSSGFT